MKNNLTVKFERETDWDAIVNHWSLNIVEEDEFLDYITKKGFGKTSPLEHLETLYHEWRVKS